MLGRETGQKHGQTAFKQAGEGAWQHGALAIPWWGCLLPLSAGPAPSRAAAQKLCPRHPLTYFLLPNPSSSSSLCSPASQGVLSSSSSLPPSAGHRCLCEAASLTEVCTAPTYGRRQQGTWGCVCSRGRPARVVTQLCNGKDCCDKDPCPDSPSSLQGGVKYSVKQQFRGSRTGIVTQLFQKIPF